MGRVRPGKHTKPPKPPSQPPQPPQPPIDPQIHRLSSSLAAPPSSNLSPHSEADLALFRPSQETVNWLYSLPLPPGVTQQPLPETSEDWALVEKFRWLCQGLVLAGEYERERRRRIERGEDPYSEWEEWDPRQSGNPLVATAVQSLMNSHAPTHPHPSYALSHPLPPHYTHPHLQYAIGNHPQYPSYPADFQPQGYDSLPTHFGGVPIDYGFAGDDEDEEEGYEDEPYSDRGGGDGEEEEIVSEHTYDFPTLETLQSFAASGSVAPLPLDPSSSSSSLPLSLDLSALTSSLGPNGLGELAAAAGVSVEGLSAAMNGQLGSLAAGVGAGEGGVGGEGGEGGTNPASLPSLIAAIAELEQCVARLSLEATEARNLQKSLRDEMSTRTVPSTSTSASANAPAGKAEAVAATLARAGLRPMKRKVKGGRVVSVSSRSRLPPSAAVKSVAAPPPVPSAPATNGHPHGHHHHHCSDCGESLSSHSAHASPSPSAPPSRPSSPPPSAPPPPLPQSLPPTAPPLSVPLPPPANANGQQGQGQQQWEDGELMKALQSVSMLDRRADEYRERLRVLKEQIHHHAALADALAAPGAASAGGAAPAAAAPAMVPVEEKKPFGQSVSDTTLELVAVSEYRHRQLSRLQQAQSSPSPSTSSPSPSSTPAPSQPPISIDPPAVPSALAPWVPPSGDYNTPMTSEELYTAMRAEREVLLRECQDRDGELAQVEDALAEQEAFEAYAEQLKKDFEEERTDPMEKSRKAQLVMDVWGRLRPEVQGRWRAEREERERRYYEERERRRKEREKEKVKGEEGKVGEGPEGGK